MQKRSTTVVLLLLLGFGSECFADSTDPIWLSVQKATPETTNIELTSGEEVAVLAFPEGTQSVSFDTSVVRDKTELPFGLKSSAKPASKAQAEILGFMWQPACSTPGLNDQCEREFKLANYDLEPGDSFQVKATFVTEVEEDDGKGGTKTKQETHTKNFHFNRMRKGSFQFGAGAFFVLSGENDYFTQAVDDGYEIISKSGDSTKLNLTATATWVPHKYQAGGGSNSGGWAFGPTLGVGTDANNLSLFLGYSAIFQRAWTITAGVAAVKEAELISQYEVGQVVQEQLDSKSLTEEEYNARVFIGLSWTPKSK